MASEVNESVEDAAIDRCSRRRACAQRLLLLLLLCVCAPGCATLFEQPAWPAWQLVWSVSNRLEAGESHGEPIVTKSLGSHQEAWIVLPDRMLVEIWDAVGHTQRLQWRTWVLPKERCVIVVDIARNVTDVISLDQFLEERLRQARNDFQKYEIPIVPSKISRNMVGIDGVRWQFSSIGDGEYPDYFLPHWALAFPGITRDDARALSEQLRKFSPQVVQQYRYRLGGTLHRTRRTLRRVGPCLPSRAQGRFPEAELAKWRLQSKSATAETLWKEWESAEDVAALRRVRFALQELSPVDLTMLDSRLRNTESVEELEELYLLLGHHDASLLKNAARLLIEDLDLSALVAWVAAMSLLDPAAAAEVLETLLSEPVTWQQVAGESWLSVESWLRGVTAWIEHRDARAL